jgi:hypothetical protein
VLEPIARRKLDAPATATDGLERALREPGRRLLELVLNRREDAVAPLLAALPPRAREALARLSPVAVVPRLPARLLVAHGEGDTSIPYTESLRLAAAAGGGIRATIFRTFHHTGPAGLWQSLGAGLADGWRLVGLADELLAAR